MSVINQDNTNKKIDGLMCADNGICYFVIFEHIWLKLVGLTKPLVLFNLLSIFLFQISFGLIFLLLISVPVGKILMLSSCLVENKSWILSSTTEMPSGGWIKF